MFSTVFRGLSKTLELESLRVSTRNLCKELIPLGWALGHLCSLSRWFPKSSSLANRLKRRRLSCYLQLNSQKGLIAYIWSLSGDRTSLPKFSLYARIQQLMPTDPLITSPLPCVLLAPHADYIRKENQNTPMGYTKDTWIPEPAARSPISGSGLWSLEVSWSRFSWQGGSRELSVKKVPTGLYQSTTA